jgi:ferrous iron transport protein B
MARVGFLGDRFLQRLGLNGRSIVPLVGGMACAIPAVMAARSIPGKRERLLTILVTPLMTCSARLPVYAFLIGFLVPDTTVGGLFNLPGLFLFGLYVASTLAALGMAWLLHRGLPRRTEGGYTLEWPAYRWPRPKDILVEMGVRGWAFVSSAGQVILVVSMVLWGLARFGPSEDMDSVRSRHAHASTVEQQAQRDADLLQASYIGHISRAIEPWVRPLGYDGTLGIALLTSFAAREVFVGTLSTLYPTAGSETGNIQALQERMTTERNPHTGKPLLQPATALSLLVFYMFAMQCMSTVAVVQRELKSWTWALGQALAFTALAYLSAWVVFQVFS